MIKKLYGTTLLVLLLLPQLAFAVLTAVGPKNPANGFPRWYQDSTGLKLQLCLDKNTHCLPLEGVNMNLPIRFPRNFPHEAFWWAGEADAEVTGGGRVQVVLAIEAAFMNDIPQRRQRISFARVRIRGFRLPVGTYRITHPYGQQTFQVSRVSGRNINFTDDVGIAREKFKGALKGAIGPFLVWDPAVAPDAPAGFIGNPDIAHEVVGSPFGTNFIKVERIDGTVREVGFTNLFHVQGKIAQ